MPKLLIVSYFNLRESLLCAANALQDKGYEISSYPLLERKTSMPDQWPSDFAQIISEERPDIILWWYIGVPYEQLASAISAANASGKIMQILYNWDDPYVWTQSTNEMDRKASLFDIAFVSCEQTLERYKSHGTAHAVYLLPGFDLGLHYYTPREDVPEKYRSDVSICCTNLYTDDSMYPDQLHPTRYEIVRALYEKYKYSPPEIEFAIYGPENLQNLFPKCYRGEVSYPETRLVFAGSRINICTHVVGNQEGYMSERVPLILGSGGLLWMDQVPQTLITDEHATFIEKSRDNIVQQVKRLLDSDLVKLRKSGFRMASQNLTWRHWAEKVHSEIMKRGYCTTRVPEIPDSFDHVAYQWENFRNHTTLTTREDCWNHWRRIGQHCGGASIRCTMERPQDSTCSQGQKIVQYQPLTLKEMDFILQADKVRQSTFKIPKLVEMEVLCPLQLYWKNV